MSLRTDYNISGALDTAFVAGWQFVLGTCSNTGYTTAAECVLGSGVWTASPAYASLSAGLATAAAQGKETFTLTMSCAHNPGALRLLGKYWATFKDGILAAMATERIFDYEVDVALNTSDSTQLQVDFNFTF
jgi:hypothetical protein